VDLSAQNSGDEELLIDDSEEHMGTLVTRSASIVTPNLHLTYCGVADLRRALALIARIAL